MPDQVLNKIEGICKTCRVCREWARPPGDNVGTTDMPDKFNQSVEGDFMFPEGVVIFHLICRCTRWHFARVCPNRETSSVITVIAEWISIFGPMKELIIDGETCVRKSEEFPAFCSRWSITYIPRPPQSHVAIIDRRTALWKECWHKALSQLKKEGIQIHPVLLCSEITFAGNA